jgi:hypothetical protein
MVGFLLPAIIAGSLFNIAQRLLPASNKPKKRPCTDSVLHSAIATKPKAARARRVRRAHQSFVAGITRCRPPYDLERKKNAASPTREKRHFLV